MIADTIGRLWHPARIPGTPAPSPEDIDAFIASRALEYASKLEDDFVQRAAALGVDSGMVLDVGAKVGLIALKLVYGNENLVAMGLDESGDMIERARETAAAWEIGDRAVFQVGDARKMRIKTGYFDLVVSDCSLHRFDDAAAVLREISRVLKPRGALLIRDYKRPNRLAFRSGVERLSSGYGRTMQHLVETSLQSAYTPSELARAVDESGLADVTLDVDRDFVILERRGQTDPNSWVVARTQFG